MRGKGFLMIICSLFLLSGCQKYSLRESADDFSFNGSEYSLKLPAGWEAEEDSKATLNGSSVFGAKDRNSNSVMFIRADKEADLSKEALEKHAKKYLKNYYDVNSTEMDSFTANKRPGIHYTFRADYEEKDSWLDIYYVSTENGVLEFFFYSQVDNSYEKRKEAFDDSVETLSEKVTGEVTEDSSEELNNKVQNDTLSMQLSSYKIETEEAGQLLVIRYVYTNKERKAYRPIDKWQEFVKVTQDDHALKEAGHENLSDDTLAYLAENSQKELNKNEVIEAAAVYSLEADSRELIIITFDQTEFPNKKPITIQVD
ncbi:DUF5067 domain-containing protein [Enterococcus sp. BWR-S5]|uniref:DUF5067 domain-containing protein n=1 Tax=Enterococcus sp. BWR-S5 TaxID=2787714 RepID=UPI001921DA37|nr:DUF5067 domain-containing protein [Enterococcus sp. BWR-S5]MBL1224033.1 DUF5067 domain-containing protein [Enterococcus sp. BWR-S5]